MNVLVCSCWWVFVDNMNEHFVYIQEAVALCSIGGCGAQ